MLHHVHQVKKNLINVSYHIAQYTNIISDLRCEIQRLKKKIAEQAGRQAVNSERADIRHVQGKLTLRSSRIRAQLQLLNSQASVCAAAEVQAHSSQQSRAEMDQLREQLLEAFRQQMAIRRSLMELENSGMEIQMDTSKHLVTITESVCLQGKNHNLSLCRHATVL